MSNPNIEMKPNTNYQDLYTSNTLNIELQELNPETEIPWSQSKIITNPLLDGYHFLCKKCNQIPLIIYVKKDKIKFLCKCPDSPKDILIIKIKEHLVNLESQIFGILKCPLHSNEDDNKYKFYCSKCKKKLCFYCNDYKEHINDVKLIPSTLEIKTIKKLNYILEKKMERRKFLLVMIILILMKDKIVMMIVY